MDGPGGGDHGSHGAFDAGARDSSWQLWANTHRGTLVAAGAVAAAVAGLVGLAGRRSG